MQKLGDEDARLYLEWLREDLGHVCVAVEKLCRDMNVELLAHEQRIDALESFRDRGHYPRLILTGFATALTAAPITIIIAQFVR